MDNITKAVIASDWNDIDDKADTNTVNDYDNDTDNDNDNDDNDNDTYNDTYNDTDIITTIDIGQIKITDDDDEEDEQNEADEEKGDFAFDFNLNDDDETPPPPPPHPPPHPPHTNVAFSNPNVPIEIVAVLLSSPQNSAPSSNNIFNALDRFFRSFTLENDIDVKYYETCACVIVEEALQKLTKGQARNIKPKLEAVSRSITLHNSTPSSFLLSLSPTSSPIPPSANPYLLSLISSELTSTSSFLLTSSSLRSAVERQVTKTLGPCTVKIYGSSLAEMATSKSDVDMSITLPKFSATHRDYLSGKILKSEYERVKKRTVYTVANSLRKSSRFINIEPIAYARIPLVKLVDCSDPGKLLSGDVCFCNDVAVENSFLVREYARFEGVKELMMCVKIWIKIADCGSAPNGTPSSYCWMNMAVFYLQVIGRVPNLQDLGRWKEDIEGKTINGLNVEFATALEVKKIGWKNESESKDWDLARLLKGFFFYYTEHFDVLMSMVSISRGGGERKYSKSVFPRSKPWRLCVEDPFETYDSVAPHDLGMVLSERGSEVMWQQLRRAREITEGGDWTTLFNSAPDNNSSKGPGKKQKKQQQQQQRKASKADKKKDRSTAKPSPAPAPPKQEHLQQQQQPGEQKPYRVRDCAYFVKHGTCKYGDSCKFRHPSVAIAPTEKPDEYDARMKARDEKKKKATERRKARRKLAKNAKKEDSEEIQQS